VVLLTLAERAAGAAASEPCEIEKKRLEKAKVSRRRRAFEEETLDILKKVPSSAGKAEAAQGAPGMGDGGDGAGELTLTDERRSFMSTRSH